MAGVRRSESRCAAKFSRQKNRKRLSLPHELRMAAARRGKQFLSLPPGSSGCPRETNSCRSTNFRVSRTGKQKLTSLPHRKPILFARLQVIMIAEPGGRYRPLRLLPLPRGKANLTISHSSRNRRAERKFSPSQPVLRNREFLEAANRNSRSLPASTLLGFAHA